MLSRLPITITAPILVALPVLVIGLLLSLMWNSQSRHAVTTLADENIEQIHELASTKVADVLSIPVRISEVNKHLIETGALDLNDLHAWRETFTKQAFAFDMLSGVVWGGADGRAAWLSRYADGEYYWAVKDDPSNPTMLEWKLNAQRDIPEAPTNSFDFNLFIRPWYITPVEHDAPSWCEPFVWVGAVDSADATLGQSYGAPVYDNDGDLLGIIDADYSLNDLSSFLRSVKIGQTGVAALMAGDGRLIAASNDTPIVAEDGERTLATDAPDAALAAAAQLLAGAGPLRGKHTEIEVDGEPHYVRASSIGRDLGLDWTLITVIPERDFLAEIDAGFTRSAIIGAIALLLAIIAGVVAAQWLVSPLVKLVTAVRRIGQGDLDTRVALSHAPEYTNLAKEINKMTEGLQDRMRLRESLSLAMEVQQNLLPSEEPDIKGLDIAGHSTYCDETGGDYYDFLDVSGAEDDAIVIAMGDVMGHGVAAAMLMATARGILRSRCAIPGSLADFLEHLNGMLVPDTKGLRFMTMLLMTMRPEQGQLRWSSAGHGPPIIFKANDESFPDYEGGGIPLGIMQEADYDEYTIEGLETGDIIVAATDGLWEAKTEDNELFGMERVQALLRKHAKKTSAELSEIFRDELARFRGPAAPDDDLTFVIVKVA